MGSVRCMSVARLVGQLFVVVDDNNRKHTRDGAWRGWGIIPRVAVGTWVGGFASASGPGAPTIRLNVEERCAGYR